MSTRQAPLVFKLAVVGAKRDLCKEYAEKFLTEDSSNKEHMYYQYTISKAVMTNIHRTSKNTNIIYYKFPSFG